MNVRVVSTMVLFYHWWYCTTLRYANGRIKCLVWKGKRSAWNAEQSGSDKSRKKSVQKCKLKKQAAKMANDDNLLHVPGLTFCIINNNKKYSQHLVIYFERNKHRTYDI